MLLSLCHSTIINMQPAGHPIVSAAQLPSHCHFHAITFTSSCYPLAAIVGNASSRCCCQYHCGCYHYVCGVYANYFYNYCRCALLYYYD